VTFSHERPNLVGPTVSETDTLSDVSAFGAHTPPGDDIVSAARSAQADVFIRRLPDGYRTRHADAPMSGGEAQRLGVARAFAHAGRVLIFDDVAASLDTVTEHEISEVLTNELQDRTRVVIAHRASTAARADLVVWLDHGRVREVASHRDLWRDRDYRSLFGSSAGDERGSDAPGARVVEVVA
jgi:ATP-binding cassette subfamily B protein